MKLLASKRLSLTFLSSDYEKERRPASSHVLPVTPSRLKTFAFFSSISAAAASNDVLDLLASSSSLPIAWIGEAVQALGSGSSASSSVSRVRGARLPASGTGRGVPPPPPPLVPPPEESLGSCLALGFLSPSPPSPPRPGAGGGEDESRGERGAGKGDGSR